LLIVAVERMCLLLI